MKLSPLMNQVIETMNSGSGYWEAVHMGGFGGGCMIQEGKIGHGGQSKRILSHTFFALLKRGVFVRAAGGTKYERYWKLAPKYLTEKALPPTRD